MTRGNNKPIFIKNIIKATIIFTIVFVIATATLTKVEIILKIKPII